jgi:translation initiation factor IF-2
MSYGKKLNELERQVDRFGIDDDFCKELCTLARKISEKFPIGNDTLIECIDRFQERRMFKGLMSVCKSHLKKYTRITKNDDTSTGDSYHSS